MNPEELQLIYQRLEQAEGRIESLSRAFDNPQMPPPHFHRVDRISQRDVRGGFGLYTTAPTFVEEEGKIAFQIADTSTTALARTLWVKLERNWYGTPLYQNGQAPMGSAFQYNTMTTISIASANTDTQVTGYTSGTLVKTTFASDQFTIASPGKYLCIWSVSFTCGTANQNFEWGYMLNTTLQTKTAAHTKVTTANDKKSCSGQGIIQMVAGDTLKLVVRNEDSAADPVIDHAQMTIVRISS